MPYFGAAAIIFSISSGPNGGASCPSLEGWPTSTKNPSNPAGVNSASILAGVSPTFL